MTDIKKATFNLPMDEIDSLKQLAESESKTVTEILRRAIKTELFISDCCRKGSKVLIETNERELREVVRL